MAVGSREINGGVEKASSAGQALTQIINMADNVGSMITQIATAAGQQSNTTDVVNSSVGKISGLTRQSSDMAEETAKACTELSNLALELQRLVSQFKVEDSTPRTSPTRQKPPIGRVNRANKANGQAVLRQCEELQSLRPFLN
jgi:hypothetical protein